MSESAAKRQHIQAASKYAEQGWRTAEDQNVKEDAERGCRFAQCALGIMYRHGDGRQQSDVQAAFWYQKAAEQGHAHAQVLLGNSFSRGIGAQQDYTKAAKWYHAAADQGDASAQLFLGLAYSAGEGVKQDYQETE